MGIRYFKIIFFVFLITFPFATKGIAQIDIGNSHINVAMRMIGHEVLLQYGDSLSRVLPVEKNANRYKIQFESDFQFEPEILVSTIDRIVKKTQIADHYLVEVEECETSEVVYSYEIGNLTTSTLIPCSKRTQPRACYRLFITIIESGQSLGLPSTASVSSDGFPPGTVQVNYLTIALWIIPLLLLLGLYVSFWKKEKQTKSDPNLISLGKMEFDKRNMELLIENRRIKLSGKEADLLLLLYASGNDTVERDRILKMVWGDEGNYVGRTLDVFISKLRKKLEADSSVKIINIRGVGYKLVMNGQN